MKITTTRFGELEVNKSDIITFKEGLLGFEKLTKFFIVDPGDQTLILWLQSIDDSNTAFPIIEPNIYEQNYSIKLLPAELASLNLEGLKDASVYTIITIPQEVTEMSANLKAPIVINNETKIARQIVLQDSKLEVRRKMYLDLKRHIMNYGTGSDDSRRSVVDIQGPSATESTETASKRAPLDKRPEA